jgi:flagellar biogenesis protein FliO
MTWRAARLPLALAIGLAALAGVAAANPPRPAAPPRATATDGGAGVVSPVPVPANRPPGYAATGPRTAPAPEAAPSFVATGGRLFLGTFLLVILLYGASRLVKRLPMAKLLPGATGPIRVKGRTYLGPKQSLCLVDVGPTTLLLAVNGQGVRTLHVWPEGLAAPVATPGPRTGDDGGMPGQLGGLSAWLEAGRR